MASAQRIIRLLLIGNRILTEKLYLHAKSKKRTKYYRIENERIRIASTTNN